jgi:L-fuculose-phosphate aldolase
MAVQSAQETPLRFPALDLRPEQEIALLCRTLFNEGYDDHLAGHITTKQPDGTLLVNPWSLAWDEVCAGDIARIDKEGRQIGGRWEVSPAVTLHVVLHEHRPDADVVVHNHSRWGTIWADSHRVPPVYDQTGAMCASEIALCNEYDGLVAERSSASTVISALGSAHAALLANHGVMVIADDVPQAFVRSMVLEWRCRQAWHVEALGRGVPMSDDAARTVVTQIDSSPNGLAGVFEAMCRRVIRDDPGVLD